MKLILCPGALAHTLSTGKCSSVAVRSALRILDCICDHRNGKWDGHQEVEAGGTGDGAFDDNHGNSEGRGELREA